MSISIMDRNDFNYYDDNDTVVPVYNALFIMNFNYYKNLIYLLYIFYSNHPSRYCLIKIIIGIHFQVPLYFKKICLTKG